MIVDRILTILQISTRYEKVSFVLAFFIGYIALAGVIYYLTKEYKSSILVLLSSIILLVLTLGSLYMSRRFLNISLTDKTQIAVWIASIINFVNLLVLSGSLYVHKQKKKFDPDHVTREHFDSTLKTFIIVLIASTAFAAFMPNEVVAIILSIATTSMLMIWINHLLSRLFLVDKSDKKGK